MSHGAAYPLKFARALRGLSQYRTAQLARISINRFFRIEHGITTPAPDEALRLEVVLGVPAKFLLGEVSVAIFTPKTATDEEEETTHAR